jgi:aldose 1-epimerase
VAGPLSPAVTERRFRGEPGIELRSGELSATFLPAVGMTGVSLRYRGREYLALPGGVDALRSGHTTGLPLLAPWANRLGSLRYRAAGVNVDLAGLLVPTDGNGLPIHGLLVGATGWRVDGYWARGKTARLNASRAVDAPAFPFPHRIDVAVSAREDRLVIDTTVVPTGRRRVPVVFGWHPYLRIADTPRAQWQLRLPARDHLGLDDRGIPTGDAHPEHAERVSVGRRTFDDLYALGRRDRRLAFSTEGGASIAMRAGEGYPYAQVWVPPGRPFAALEPMTAPTNALAGGSPPLVAPGDAFTARFTLAVT